MTELSCLFCRKTKGQVGILVVKDDNPNVGICNVCIGVCLETISKEFFKLKSENTSLKEHLPVSSEKYYLQLCGLNMGIICGLSRSEINSKYSKLCCIEGRVTVQFLDPSCGAECVFCVPEENLLSCDEVEAKGKLSELIEENVRIWEAAREMQRKTRRKR